MYSYEECFKNQVDVFDNDKKKHNSETMTEQSLNRWFNMHLFVHLAGLEAFLQSTHT